MTEGQMRALRAIAACRNQMASADVIAHKLGYRPARHGRLAVTRMLRPLLDPKGKHGQLVARIPPADQWEAAIWGLTRAGDTFIAEQEEQEHGTAGR